jgi:hypothetical protein
MVMAHATKFTGLAGEVGSLQVEANGTAYAL